MFAYITLPLLLVCAAASAQEVETVSPLDSVQLGNLFQLKAGGAPKVVVHDLARCDMAEAVGDAFRFSKLVLATTTYNADIFPFMREFINHLTERNFSNRTVALIENGSWAPLAAKVMRGMLEPLKNLTFTDTTVRILSAMNEESAAQLDALSEELCREYRAQKSETANKNDLSALFNI